MSEATRGGTADPGSEARESETESGTPKWPVVGVVLAVLWLFVRGVAPGETVEATLRTLLGEFLIGLAVGWPTAFALRQYYTPRVSVRRSLRVTPYAVLYLVVFLRELVTANVDVAYRVLAPSMPIRPDVIAIPLRVETDAAVTTIANSITLTPGTLTMDHDAETNTLYVHVIAVRDRDRVVEPIRTWEDYALVIFEGRDPNVEVPRESFRGPAADPARDPTEGERDRSTEGEVEDEDEDRPTGVGERSPPRSPDGDGMSGGDAGEDTPEEEEGGDGRGR